MTAQHSSRALLVLADGTRFEGRAYGSEGRTLGTIRLHVDPTGYQELLTDEATQNEIVLFTTPHIGIVGMNDEDAASGRIQSAGLIVRDPARKVSNFRAQRSLDEDLTRDRIVGISGVDTRAITRRVSASTEPVVAGIFSGPDADLPADELVTIVNNVTSKR